MLVHCAARAQQVQSSQLHVKFSLCPKKREKWIEQLRVALATGHLDAGNASKLAGKLNFATQHMFRRLGRAMIRPIYAQTCSGTGKVGARLREALEWWSEILSLDISECCPFGDKDGQLICKLFVDAASTPACCAAVLCCDGILKYTSAKPCNRMLGQLAARRDKQITSLVRLCFCNMWAPLCGMQVCQEILSIYLALTTFTDELRGRRVILYSDNKGSYEAHVYHIALAMWCYKVQNTQPREDRPVPSITIR